MRVSTHDLTRGVLIQPELGDDLDVVATDDLRGWVRDGGHVLLRGFTADREAFSRFVKHHSGRISLDPARTFDNPESAAQKVDAGVAPLGLHCENGNSPFWPDSCWFFCDKAPSEGSQTTVCDGTSVFEELIPDDRDALLANEIVYVRDVEQPLWTKFAIHASGLPRRDHDIDVLFEHLSAQAGEGGAELTLNPDLSITYRFRISAIQTRSAYGHVRPAFANSIFGPSFNYARPAISFSDGRPLSDAMKARLADACRPHTHEIGWQDGDIVLIDNYRVMHGRTHIKDKTRVIYNSLSYIRA